MNIRITEEKNGRVVSMSPRYDIPLAAAALDLIRRNDPRPGSNYRVWRILDNGRRARCIGNVPGYYPLPPLDDSEFTAPLADIPADTSPGPMLHAADFQA